METESMLPVMTKTAHFMTNESVVCARESWNMRIEGIRGRGTAGANYASLMSRSMMTTQWMQCTENAALRGTVGGWTSTVSMRVAESTITAETMNAAVIVIAVANVTAIATTTASGTATFTMIIIVKQLKWECHAE